MPEGGFVTMLGPSGCGKSTLLRAIADLVPIAGGGISVFGRTPEQARRARDFAFVFQDATLLPWRSAVDNVRLPLEVGRQTGHVEQHAEPEELLRIWRETGTTIMFVTHSMPEAAFLGRKCLVLSAQPGRVREYVDIGFAEPRALAMRDTLEFVQVTAHLRSLLEEAK